MAGPSLDEGEAAGELTTPTGAALVRAFVSEFGPMPPMVPQAVGYGAGTRDLGFPNVARIVIGELAGREVPPLNAASVQADERAPLTELVTVLETNIDHLTSEELAFAADELLSAGALDVWQTPIVMKKGRAAVALEVYLREARPDLAVSSSYELLDSARFAGLLLAIPMAAVIQVILDRSLLRPQASGLEVPAGRDRLSKLRYETQEYVVDIRNLAQHKQTGTVQAELDQVEDTLEAIAMDLDRALAEATVAEDVA